MRLSYVLFLSIFSWQAMAPAIAAKDSQNAAAQEWNSLRTKREALKSFHQEFAVSRNFKTSQHDQASKYSDLIDGAAGRWREQTESGSIDQTTVFDGKDLFEFEKQGDEYVRLKPSSKDNSWQPDPYGAAHLDLSKAVEVERHACGFTNIHHECVTIEVPVRPWVRYGDLRPSKVTNGLSRFVFDTVNGLLISSQTVENHDNGHTAYQSDIVYTLKRMSYNNDPGESLFRLPSSATREVKKLSAWNADRIKKELAGKTAPDLTLTNIQGKTLKLSDLKGKTVLLDFWATWCGPCREDGPSLDKLYRKYGGKNLAIIGISVDEDPSVVRKFLGEHPHQYNIALTTDNEMPQAYRVGVLPTYIVIDPEGNLAFVTQGETGFSELRSLLKKAGLETD